MTNRLSFRPKHDHIYIYTWCTRPKGPWAQFGLHTVISYPEGRYDLSKLSLHTVPVVYAY